MIKVLGGTATWDWQIKKWFARIYEEDFTVESLDELSAITPLTDEEREDLLQYKQHCEVINGGSN